MSSHFPDDDEPKKRPWLAIGAAVLVIGGLALAFTLKGGDGKPKPKKVPETISIVLPPPPPPPPPPPKPEPPKPEEKQEMVQQEKIEEDVPPPPAETPPDDPAPDMSTNLAGPGDNGFGLSLGTGRGGGGTGTGVGNGGRKAGKYDAYAGKVQSELRDALQRNAKTRMATFNGSFSVWLDGTGRVLRAKGADATASDALVGTQLSAPPPADMPMPIRLRIAASRPVAASR